MKNTALTDHMVRGYAEYCMKHCPVANEANPEFLREELKWRARIEHVKAVHRETAREYQKKKRGECAALLRKIRKCTSELRQLTAQIGYLDVQYPPVPSPMIHVTQHGDGLPEASGVYFVWHNGVIAYVGQSVNLKGRARAGHEYIQNIDMLSWLELPMAELDWAECYYIGTTRPPLNFRQRAKRRSTA